ncbi:MAG: hypothetical protein LLG00_00455 [Planctomycetaceae bacterium]|nr:hypothetical protein [Planctomycetaceae bacterium]
MALACAISSLVGYQVAFAKGGPGGGHPGGGGSFGGHGGAPMNAGRPAGMHAGGPGWSAGRSFVGPQTGVHTGPRATVGVNPWMASRSGFHNNAWFGSRVATPNTWNRTGTWNHTWHNSNWNHNQWNHGNWWTHNWHNNWHNNWWNHNWWNHGWNRWWYYGGYWPWYGFGTWPWYYGSSYGYSYPYDSGYSYSVPSVTYGYGYPYYSGADVSEYEDELAPYTGQYEGEQPQTETAPYGETQPDYMAQATDAFRSGDFGNAVRLAGHAALDDPRNPNVHLMLMLGLFAMGQYRPAAAEAHAVASLGEVPTWAMVYEIYGSVEPYTEQLRALEKFVRENPKSAEARFLLGFEYLITGHREAAGPQLLAALKAMPRDRVAAELLTKAGGAVPPEIAKELARPPAVKGATGGRERTTAAKPATPPSPQK